MLDKAVTPFATLTRTLSTPHQSLMQHWFNLSDPGAEEALYDMESLRRFAGIDLGREPVPDETTICKFRHLMEQRNLGDALFHKVNAFLAENGLAVSRSTIVDATLIDAPTSTKNQQKQRDPDMHSTKKGNQLYFGMKAHLGVDSRTKLIHSVAVTAANVHDSQVLETLLHGEETRVCAMRPTVVRPRYCGNTRPTPKILPTKGGQPLSRPDRPGTAMQSHQIEA